MNNYTIMIFPNQKKQEKSPDYRGFLKNESSTVADLMIYSRVNKTMQYLAMYVLWTDKNLASAKIRILNLTFTSTDPKKPNVGDFIFGNKSYKIALWTRTDKNGNPYYSGKITENGTGNYNR